MSTEILIKPNNQQFTAIVTDVLKRSGRPLKLGNVEFSLKSDGLCYDLPVNQWNTEQVGQSLAAALSAL